MKRLGFKISLAVVAVLFTLSVFAQGGTTFTTNAPMKVAVGETFRVEFTLNAEPVNGSFTPPPFKGFDVIAGPSTSYGSSMVSINNKVTQSVNYTFTYVVTANNAGTNTIGTASVEVGKKRYTTKPLPIEVITESAASQQQQAESDNNNPGDRIGKDDILLRTTVSRKSLFKGEPLRVTTKLYRRVTIVNLDNEKIPSFNGFWSQKLDNTHQEVQRETYNGKLYTTHTLYDYLLYPQQAGKITIEPFSLTAMAQVNVRNSRPDPFFGSQFSTAEIRRAISSNKVIIDVKELPSGAPESFNGAVGNFSLECNLTPDVITANSSMTYKVRISGTGNLSLMQAPEVLLPSTFEKYNVKTTESIQTNQNGASGYKQFEYPIIPRAEGEYSLQPTKFTYFNTQSMQYETLESPIYNIEILPDGSSSSSSDGATVRRSLSREDVKILGEDIRFIKIEAGEFKKERMPFILSKAYYLTLGVIFALFAAIFFVLRRRIKESQNSSLVRGKKANKIAVQRFKAANNFMKSNNEREFYKEVLTAIWGYMGDKFNIPVANLTKESVRRELSKRGVSNDLVEDFSKITTLCDEAQYSPMASAQMNEVYVNAIKLISKIETEIKR